MSHNIHAALIEVNGKQQLASRINICRDSIRPTANPSGGQRRLGESPVFGRGCLWDRRNEPPLASSQRTGDVTHACEVQVRSAG